MGTFIGHGIPGTVFFCLGLWHLYSAFRNYAMAPLHYQARVWHPVKMLGERFIHLELWLIAGGCAFDMVFELLLTTGWKPLEDGMVPMSLLNDYEHSGMLLMFLLFALIVILHETVKHFRLPQAAPHAMVALCFFVEYLLFSFHSSNRAGLEAQSHILLLYAIQACGISSVLLCWKPEAFLVDVVACMALILQGTWFWQVAFSLYMPGFIPKGCHHDPDLPDGTDGPTTCDSEMDTHRAMALMNMLFMLHLAVTLVATVLAYAASMRCWGRFGARSRYLPVGSDDTDEGKQGLVMEAVSAADIEMAQGMHQL